MSTHIQVGILSFAHYHANFWAQAINDHPDATLVGIWDDDTDRGLEAAERHESRFWPDLDLLLRDCDVVGVTSETVRHAPLVEAAASAGVHILLEKPMATTLADCDRIERAVAEGGVMFMLNFPKRFDPINQELIGLVRDGQLGDIGLVRIRHGHHHGLDPSFTRQWYTDPELSGGGTLIDEGIHAADFLRWLLGSPERVHATLSSSVLRLSVEDTAAATFIFPNGAIADVTTGWSFVAADQSIEIYGTIGTAILGGVDLASRDVTASPYLRVFTNNAGDQIRGDSPTVPGFIDGGFHEQGIRRFIACVRAGHCDEVGLEEGRGSLAMILTAYRSARTGATQAIDNRGSQS